MESLSDTIWDVVICGTGLQQSLLALALSRSDLKVLHLDPHDYYGGPDAALSLQDAETWAAQHGAKPEQEAVSEIFSHATIQKLTQAEGSEARLSFPRAYSLALAPQIIHARSTLLSQLVSSRAYRQIEFLAVGSFFVLKREADLQSKPTLLRIPSTREDVFSSTALTARSKRALMKFLKFVLDYDSEDEKQAWYSQKGEALTTFLQQNFSLDEELQSYILALTLSLDGKVSTGDGLAIINRHLTSMGIFGTGFAAVYPKWGGLSEIAQVACRAGAVGGAVYMLDTNVKTIKDTNGAKTGDPRLEIELSNGTAIRAKALVRQTAHSVKSVNWVAKLIVVVGSSLPLLFKPTVEGAPTPAVAVIACPPGRLAGSTAGLENPVYVTAHSADSGECPDGQSVLYLSTMATSRSKEVLEQVLADALGAVVPEAAPSILYRLYYEQAQGSGQSERHDRIFEFPAPPGVLLFQDTTLDYVRKAWKFVRGDKLDDEDAGFMVFPDREGVGDDDDIYDQ